MLQIIFLGAKHYVSLILTTQLQFWWLTVFGTRARGRMTLSEPFLSCCVVVFVVDVDVAVVDVKKYLNIT